MSTEDTNITNEDPTPAAAPTEGGAEGAPREATPDRAPAREGGYRGSSEGGGYRGGGSSGYRGGGEGGAEGGGYRGRRPRDDDDDSGRDRDPRGGRGGRPGGGAGGGRAFFRKKIDKIKAHNLVIDYKHPEVLRRFVTEKGKILPRRITGTSAKNQRRLVREIKRARAIALLPIG